MKNVLIITLFWKKNFDRLHSIPRKMDQARRKTNNNRANENYIYGHQNGDAAKITY